MQVVQVRQNHISGLDKACREVVKRLLALLLSCLTIYWCVAIGNF
jgi:hypothetical protein